MDMTPILLGLASALLGGGGVVSVANLVLNRRRPAVDTRAVEVATAGDAVGMSLEVATAALEQVKVLTAEGADLRARMEASDAKAESAVVRATRAENLLDLVARWAQNIVDHWDEVRTRPHPPQLPAAVRDHVAGHAGGTYTDRTTE